MDYHIWVFSGFMQRTTTFCKYALVVSKCIEYMVLHFLSNFLLDNKMLTIIIETTLPKFSIISQQNA
jgi:hypothetical protein